MMNMQVCLSRKLYNLNVPIEYRNCKFQRLRMTSELTVLTDHLAEVVVNALGRFDGGSGPRLAFVMFGSRCTIITNQPYWQASALRVEPYEEPSRLMQRRSEVTQSTRNPAHAVPQWAHPVAPTSRSV